MAGPGLGVTLLIVLQVASGWLADQHRRTYGPGEVIGGDALLSGFAVRGGCAHSQRQIRRP